MTTRPKHKSYCMVWDEAGSSCTCGLGMGAVSRWEKEKKDRKKTEQFRKAFLGLELWPSQLEVFEAIKSDKNNIMPFGRGRY